MNRSTSGSLDRIIRQFKGTIEDRFNFSCCVGNVDNLRWNGKHFAKLNSLFSLKLSRRFFSKLDGIILLSVELLKSVSVLVLAMPEIAGSTNAL